ncbi:MAG: hypothetical protein KKI02_09905 [Planctomycetes bacterium]|nr:hypothetical protein [Planctomycetota bacterium]
MRTVIYRLSGEHAELVFDAAQAAANNPEAEPSGTLTVDPDGNMLVRLMRAEDSARTPANTVLFYCPAATGVWEKFGGDTKPTP